MKLKLLAMFSQSVMVICNINFKTALFFLSSIFLFNCSQKKAAKEQLETIKEVVDAKVVELTPAKNIILPGDLKPWEVVNIHAKVKGYVLSVNADRGTHVQKGQMLAILEAPELKEQLAEAMAHTEDYRSQYLTSKLTFQRIRETSKTEGAIAANEIDVARSKMIVDSMQVISAVATYNARQEMVNYLALRAPFSGIITERNISPGDLVGPETTNKPLFVLENSETIRLTIAIPEIYSSELKTGTTVTFKVNALPEKEFSAKLSRSSQTLDIAMRSMFAEFDVPNPAHLLKAGMYAEVRMPVERSAPTFFVPSSSVVNSTERVFVIEIADGYARWITVKTGTQLDTLTEVFGPLHVGEAIVKKASEEIRDGSKVRTGKR